MKTIKWITLIVLSTLLGILTGYIVLDVSKLYGLTFISDLGFLKVYALVGIIRLLNLSPKDFSINDKDSEVGVDFTRIVLKTSVYLLFWGSSYLMFYILK